MSKKYLRFNRFLIFLCFDDLQNRWRAIIFWIMITDEQIAENYCKYRRCKAIWMLLGGLAGTVLATLVMIIMALMLLVLVSGRNRYHHHSWMEQLSPMQLGMVFMVAFAAVLLIGVYCERRQPGDIGVRNQSSDPTAFGTYAIFIFTFAQNAFWRGVMLMLHNYDRDEATVAVWLCRRNLGADCAEAAKETGVPAGRFLPGFLYLDIMVPLADRRKIALASKVKERLMSESEITFWQF